MLRRCKLLILAFFAAVCLNWLLLMSWHVNEVNLIRRLKQAFERRSNPPPEGIFLTPHAWKYPQELFLLIFINSSPHDKVSRHRRDSIRETWGSDCRKQNLAEWKERTSGNASCKIVFVSGLAGNSVLNEKMLDEHNEFGDILIIDHIDEYRSTSLKMMADFRWAKDLSPQFVLKTDDDIYVALHLVVHYLIHNFTKTIEKHTPLYAGTVFSDAPPERLPHHQHYVSMETFDKAVFPPFVTGGLVLISGSLLGEILRIAHLSPLVPLDDVNLGILMQKLMVNATRLNQNICMADDMPRLPPWEWESCDYYRCMAIGHYLDEAHQRTIHGVMTQLRTKC